MLNVSKQIYRKIDNLLPDLQNIEPYNRVNLSGKGLPDINAVVFESTPENIQFVLSRYTYENGKAVPNPYFEIAVNPRSRVANVVTYKDDHYFHTAVPKVQEIGTMAQTQANRFLYDFLGGLKERQPRAKG